LNWNDIYSLGNDRIDKEHKNLFKIAAEAFSVVNPDNKIKKVKSVLEKLLLYTKNHFEHEEHFMQSIKYPGLEEHKVKHKKIILSMKSFVKNLPNMKIIEIEKELAHFIEIWFIAHIVYEDKKLSQWINNNEIPEFSFSWKSSYSIGNTTIDAEHQELFQIASEAFKRVPSNEKKRKIVSTLNKLFHYFQEHFKNEENYMESLKYDKLENHKTIHVEIMQTLSQLTRNSATMDIESIEENLTNFIEESLVNHIMNEDKKISHWIQFLKDLEEAKELKEV
jgi:hemerythrin